VDYPPCRKAPTANASEYHLHLLGLCPGWKSQVAIPPWGPLPKSEPIKMANPRRLMTSCLLVEEVKEMILFHEVI
jgi:hypothetical protein